MVANGMAVLHSSVTAENLLEELDAHQERIGLKTIVMGKQERVMELW